ncbi:hypothetical protein GIB67_017516 [Kingdonia uniflora]|uniref:F-box domain-containing protein n=1 Tax=Kingdonia uniflora TaxID=39325 RepID=A0A7J7M4I9_9MAGN|nr:hypothetical protein GIB67_017516 [Kingdonia uniflora]
MAETLPDEIWRRILEIGIQESKLSFKDLCCISISNRRLKRLSNETPIWSSLLTLDFPNSKTLDFKNPCSLSQLQQPLQTPHPKTLYKSNFEKDRARKLAVHCCAVLRIESQIAVYSRNLVSLRRQLVEEKARFKDAVDELADLEKIRL